MELNLNLWQEFKIGKLFDVKKGKRLTSNEQEDGPYNYIGSIDSNNGVANHISQLPIHKGNTITLSYNGSVGEAFYQKEDYWATDDVNALYPKFDGFNELIGLFLITIIKNEKYRFSYGRKWTLTKMKATTIKLPVQLDSNSLPIIDKSHKFSKNGYIPDWKFMEKYIHSLNYKPITTENKQNSGKIHLNSETWEEFQIKELFNLEPTKGDDTHFLIAGNDISYIAAKHDYNGLSMMCSKEGMIDYISKGNCIIFVNIGAGSAGYTNYIKNDFIGMSGKTTCGYIDCMTPAIGLFISTILSQERPKYSFGRSWTGDRLKNTVFRLPIKRDENGKPLIDPKKKYSKKGYIPDWEFMENYIKNLPHGDRLQG